MGTNLRRVFPWSEDDWEEYLVCEADSLIEAFVTEDDFGEALNE